MSKLIIGCGIPGTGKSTYIRQHLQNKDMWVSRDKIRFSLLGENFNSADYFSKEDEVWELFIKTINAGLAGNMTVWADATHLSRRGRLKLLNALKIKPDEIEIIDFWCPLEVALERNEERKNTCAYVPRSQIRRMYYQREAAEFGENQYEYNKIYEINTVNGETREREVIFK